MLSSYEGGSAIVVVHVMSGCENVAVFPYMSTGESMQTTRCHLQGMAPGPPEHKYQATSDQPMRLSSGLGALEAAANNCALHLRPERSFTESLTS